MKDGRNEAQFTAVDYLLASRRYLKMAQRSWGNEAEESLLRRDMDDIDFVLEAHQEKVERSKETKLLHPNAREE